MNKKCKNCAHYISEPDKQDGVTERYCTETSERVNPNWTCPLWTKDISKKETKMEISKEVIEMSKLPWFPVMMKELGYEPVRHGQWIAMSDADGIYYACSECGESLERKEDYDPQFDLFPRLKSIDKPRYCSNCGAKMEDANE